MAEQGWDFPDDLPEAAWGIIANAWGGDWTLASPEWREAAERWRDAYHETLGRPGAAEARAVPEMRAQFAEDAALWIDPARLGGTVAARVRELVDMGGDDG